MTQRTSLALAPERELERLLESVQRTSSPDQQALLSYVRAELRARAN
jgi:hypothetical protein